jgi:D-alanyl-D-alanine carboxypeptidase
MFKKISAFLLLSLLLHSCVRDQPVNKARLDSYFAAINTHHQNMGSIAIARNGVLVYQNAIGYSEVNKALKTPATIGTKYRIGSISKMFTATMIFQLIDEGKLTFKTTLAAYFPQLPNAGKITIGEMLDHRTGLHNFTSDPAYFSYMTTPKSEAEMLGLFAGQKPDFEPGTKGVYSNTNYILLGYIIERVTGKTYPEELKERVASKIGLADTYYGTKVRPAENEAYPYNYAGEWTQMRETDMSIPGGAGAIVSTSADLVKFITALFEGRLITLASLSQMKTMKDDIGMGMFALPFDDKKGYGHTGHIDGFSSQLIYFPQERLAIAYISNGMRYSVYDVIAGALSIYFNKPFTIPEFKTITLSSAELDKYVGKYSSTQIALKIDISKRNAMLFAQATGQPVPLEAKGGDKFFYSTDGVAIQFEPVKKSFSLMQAGHTYLFTKIN